MIDQHVNSHVGITIQKHLSTKSAVHTLPSRYLLSTYRHVYLGSYIILLSEMQKEKEMGKAAENTRECYTTLG